MEVTLFASPTLPLNAHAHSHSLACTHTQPFTRMHTHTKSLTYQQIHIHTHMHTHTHFLNLPIFFSLSSLLSHPGIHFFSFFGNAHAGDNCELGASYSFLHTRVFFQTYRLLTPARNHKQFFLSLSVQVTFEHTPFWQFNTITNTLFHLKMIRSHTQTRTRKKTFLIHTHNHSHPLHTQAPTQAHTPIHIFQYFMLNALEGQPQRTQKYNVKAFGTFSSI